MSEDRFITLEIKLAEQEDSLRILNEVLIRQTEQIDRLEALCRQLKERLDRLGDGSQEKLSLAEEVPPHY
ncbi:MAG: SlyX family protein [Nevskiaceae bacterium]|jgi:SlyX protein|nr:MAG: SlyX family protein [Nevskiaceae bacterium]